MEHREVIPVLLGALAVCAISRADMMPLHPAETLGGEPARIGTAADLYPTDRSRSWADFPDLAGLDSSPVGFLRQPDPEAGQTGEVKPAQILTDRQSSLTLCLYALLSLGLYQSAPFFKKFHFSFIPDWYHSGGPSQIGHSFAISPDFHPTAPVFCVLQPDPGTITGDIPPQFHRRIVVSFWRKSQFTPATLAPRGPPHLS